MVKLSHTEHQASLRHFPLGKAMRDWRVRRAQEVPERTLNDENRCSRDYVGASLGLEAQMRQARTALRNNIAKLETG